MKQVKQEKQQYYNISKLLKTNATYRIVFGERSNGKTFQIILHGLKRNIENGTQIAILRRWKEDFKLKYASTYFDSLVCDGEGKNHVAELTGGKYDKIVYDSGKWYLAKYDEEQNKNIYAPEPLAYAFALSDMEHGKGNSYPMIRIIFLDEFMTRKIYLPDEFVLFMNNISTIVRSRNDVEIFMAANTVSQYCPYFEEMGLTHVRQMKQGDIDIYKYGNSKLKVAVEYADSPSTGKPSDVYFAFDNPKLQMITGGKWELDIYPHLQTKYKDSEVQFRYFVIFKEHILQCNIVARNNEMFTFIHKKTTELKDQDKDIIFTTEADQRNNYMGRLTKPTNKLGKKLLWFFVVNKVFYASNEVGEIMNNYLNWSNNLQKM